ncbi:uncharacterized protein LOC130262617 [Oenanthe melanoleuca]|uniref:uncharacterized protein LOC130262617 n=1 Tax=Oenanthe melanoleuca TaxID=2939378 RepID=UPI0024C1FF73|nr:uncharacterized protein LOC130262617 [Oenanthe melanoleuca]
MENVYRAVYSPKLNKSRHCKTEIFKLTIQTPLRVDLTYDLRDLFHIPRWSGDVSPTALASGAVAGSWAGETPKSGRYFPGFGTNCCLRVLTADFCEGCKITNVQGIQELGLGLRDTAEKLIQVFAEQIFYTGFIHADPHPGNVLVQRGPDGKAQLVLLDHGLYETLSERDRVSLCGLWRAIVLRDHGAMRDRAAELGVQDYFLFSEMLMQRPLGRRSRLLGGRGAAHLAGEARGPQLQGAPEGHLSGEERGYMQSMAAQRFPHILQVLRALPRPMLLVFRNINTVRSVHAALGAPADRYGIMARRNINTVRSVHAALGAPADRYGIMARRSVHAALGAPADRYGIMARRNINTVRSVHAALGAPADRYGIMARRNINTVRSVHAALGAPADRYGIMARRNINTVRSVHAALGAPADRYGIMARRNINTVRSVHAALGAPADRYGIMARRNINTVRSVHAALGAPADRYGIMAHSAVRSWSRLRGGPGGSLRQRLHLGWESLKFELALRGV